jgi:hypothetical protein
MQIGRIPYGLSKVWMRSNQRFEFTASNDDGQSGMALANKLILAYGKQVVSQLVDHLGFWERCM